MGLFMKQVVPWANSESQDIKWGSCTALSPPPGHFLAFQKSLHGAIWTCIRYSKGISQTLWVSRGQGDSSHHMGWVKKSLPLGGSDMTHWTRKSTGNLYKEGSWRIFIHFSATVLTSGDAQPSVLNAFVSTLWRFTNKSVKTYKQIFFPLFLPFSFISVFS